MRFRCDSEQAVTRNRICADAHLRLRESRNVPEEEARSVFATGRKPRESLSAARCGELS